MTKEIGTLLTEPTSPNASEAKVTEAKKEGASLFDSLVQSASTEVSEETQAKSGDKGSGNTSEQKTTVAQQTSPSKESSSTNSNESSQNVKGDSLLDRMLVEAKRTMQSDSVITPSGQDQSNELNSEETLKNSESSTVTKQGEVNASKEPLLNQESLNNTAEESQKALVGADQMTSVEDVENDASNKQNSNEPETAVKKDGVESTSKEPKDKSEVVKPQINPSQTGEQNVEENSELAKSEGKTNGSEPVKTVPSSELSKVTSTQESVEEVQTKPTTQTQKPESTPTVQNTPLDSVEPEIEATKVVDAKAPETTKIKESLFDRLSQQQTPETKQASEPDLKNSELKTSQVQAEKPLPEQALKTEQKVESKPVETALGNKGLNIEQASKNETVAKELAALNTQEELPEVKLSQEALKEESKLSKKEQNDSLLDRMIKNAKQQSDLPVEESNNTLNKQVQQSVETKGEVASNIFLKNQQKVMQDASMQQTVMAKAVVSEGSSVEDIKEGAKLLDLNMKEAKLDVQKQEIKDGLNKDNFKSALLDRLAFNQTVAKFDLATIANAMQTPLNSVNVIEDPMVLQVNNNLAMNIQGRIVGAHQQMGSMMSEVARQMVENYKPPVTAFRINLMPAHLGQIAIMMKSDKENNLSISLNLSNSNTLEAMQESENNLRSALIKGFGEDMNLSLDFSMNSDSGSSFEEQTSQGQKQPEATQDIIESITTQKEEDESLSYM